MAKRTYDEDELEVVDYAVLTLSTTGALTMSSTGCTVNANSTAFTNKVKRALVTIEVQNCRFRMDGTAPTAAEGHPLYPGDIMDMTGRGWGTLLNSTSLLQFIATTGAPKLRITYFR